MRALVLTTLILGTSVRADTSTSNPPVTEPTTAIKPYIDSKSMKPINGGASTPMPVATPLPTLSDLEKKSLITEFEKAMATQKSAQAHQEKSAFKELQAAQSMKLKKWREEQKKERHAYFDQHISGPERRDYVQAYNKKIKEFDQSMKDELAASKKSWADKEASLKVFQKNQEDQFKDSLAHGIRPQVSLWPTGN